MQAACHISTYDEIMMHSFYRSSEGGSSSRFRQSRSRLKGSPAQHAKAMNQSRQDSTGGDENEFNSCTELGAGKQSSNLGAENQIPT